MRARSHTRPSSSKPKPKRRIVRSLIAVAREAGRALREAEGLMDRSTDRFMDRSTDRSSRWIGTTLILEDRYRVYTNKVLGTGGFGEVCEGSILDDPTVPVCVKIEHPKRSKKKGSPLVKESKILRFLAAHHQQLCPKYYDLVTYEGSNYLIMEQLGQSLESYRKKRGYLTAHSILMLGDQIVMQLHALHNHGLIHRDLKPHNIMFDLDERYPYLIDYGLSKKYRTQGKHVELTKCSPVGTTKYMSPNVHQRLEQSRRDDLWSLGYILAYLHLGTLPWDHLCKKCSRKSERDRRHGLLYNIKVLKRDELEATLPSYLQDYFAHVAELEFEATPDYRLLRSIFLRELQSRGEERDFQWDWHREAELSA